MAQPHYVVEYLGAMSVIANKVYYSVDIKTDFPTANMMRMKTPNVSVSINSTDMFLTSFDDETYIPSTNTSYIFDKDCTIVIGTYIGIT